VANPVTVRWQRQDAASAAWGDLPGETGFSLQIAGAVLADDGRACAWLSRRLHGPRC